jgi:hypothetical protein
MSRTPGGVYVAAHIVFAGERRSTDHWLTTTGMNGSEFSEFASFFGDDTFK